MKDTFEAILQTIKGKRKGIQQPISQDGEQHSNAKVFRGVFSMSKSQSTYEYYSR